MLAAMFFDDLSFCYRAPFDSAYEKNTLYPNFKYINYHGSVILNDNGYFVLAIKFIRERDYL